MSLRNIIEKTVQYVDESIETQATDTQSTYVPLSRTINSKPLSANVTLTATDVGAVPTTRTINSKALSTDVTLSSSDIGALPTDGSGLMTNLIQTSSTSGYVSKNNSHIGHWAGTASSTAWSDRGASLRLFSRSNTESGIFSLASYDGTTEKSLVGKPSGALTWGGTPVLTGASIGDANTPVYISSSGVVTSTGKSFANYLLRAGDTMTGQLAIDYASIPLSFTNISAGTYRDIQALNATTSTRLGAIRFSASTTENSITIGCSDANNSAPSGLTVTRTIGDGTSAGTVTVTSVTPATSDSSTKVATTAYVKANVPKSIGSATQGVYTNSNGVVTAMTYELNKTVPSDAVFTDTNNRVQTVVTNPTSNTTYRIGFVGTSAAAQSQEYINDGLTYITREGTTSQVGTGYCITGNSIASGTAGNKQGYFRVYGQNTGYGDITYANSTSNATHTFPATSGTVLNSGTTSFTQTVTSGREIGKLKINGTTVSLYQDTAVSGTGIPFVKGANGVAANTTSGSYYAAQWKGTNSNITSLYDGLMIAFRVQVAGNATYGTLLQINSLDAKPVVVNVNTMVGTRYGVGCTLLLVYNSTQTATAYVDNTSTTFTGCWQLAEYDSTNINQLRMSNGSYLANAALYRNMLLFKVSETKLQPANTTSNSTGTSKTLMTSEFDPHGEIYYYNSTTTVSSGGTITANTLYMRINLDLRYSFNTGTTLTANKSVYLKCSPKTNGNVTFASGNPIVQALPTTADGFVYIYLGQASSTSNLDLHVRHPIYHYYNNALRLWVGPV